eukprot:SAG31_NODE_203_length_20490_cov_7.713256_6_plen_58_part_00
MWDAAAPDLTKEFGFDSDDDCKGCYFLVFVQLLEKYGTLIERNTALIEKVSPRRDDT